MKGRKPWPSRLGWADRHVLQAMLADGQLRQRLAHRARALLALARGARIQAMVHWLGWSRAGLWHLGQRYQPWGVDAVFDVKRSG